VALLCAAGRYYVAEGVRLYSQETWRQVMGTIGRSKVAKFINQVRAGDALWHIVGWRTQQLCRECCAWWRSATGWVSHV
jgi:hypothetical protein